MENTRANIFEIGGEVPNAETIAALEEVKRMKANPSLYKTYSSLDEIVKELLADEPFQNADLPMESVDRN